jgi:hypothetical protein
MRLTRIAGIALLGIVLVSTVACSLFYGISGLSNNHLAHNPSWNELEDFLKQDDTDQQSYVPSSFDCDDFARMLHNNAEKFGIRAAVVLIHFEGKETGHALNAFQTTDMGLVYIDNSCSDSTVDVSVGNEYSPGPGWYSTAGRLGIVTNVFIQW